MNITSDQFNAAYPVGTAVIYSPITGRSIGEIESTTRTPAWELGCGESVVSIEGKSGGVSLSNIRLK